MAEEIIVSAAASLTDAFTRLGVVFSAREPGAPRVLFNFAASGALAQQIRAGAPVDVFASASPEEMDGLQRANRIEAASRVDFAGNRLVLVVPAASQRPVKDWSGLADARRVALGQPESVPAGRYAQAVLEARGLWKRVQPRVIFAENVRQALAYVANGDADAGIVFATDARAAGKRVRVVATAVPGRDHPAVRYPAAVVRGSAHAASARRFVRFLGEPEARRVLTGFGFAPPPPPQRQRAR